MTHWFRVNLGLKVTLLIPLSLSRPIMSTMWRGGPVAAHWVSDWTVPGSNPVADI